MQKSPPEPILNHNTHEAKDSRLTNPHGDQNKYLYSHAAQNSATFPRSMATIIFTQAYRP